MAALAMRGRACAVRAKRGILGWKIPVDLQRDNPEPPMRIGVSRDMGDERHNVQAGWHREVIRPMHLIAWVVFWRLL